MLTSRAPMWKVAGRPGRRSLRASLVGLAATAMLVTPLNVGAVVPGANGRLACEGSRNDPSNTEVFTIDPDGSGETVLTDHPSRDGDPSFSPDGTRIAFESFRDDGSEVYVMNADGTGVTRLTFNGPAEDRGTSWSPDGSQIVFHSGRFTPATPGPGFSSLEIFKMNADGSDQIRLTENNFQDSLPSWSPDGSKIAFTSNRDDDFEIYVMNADGTDQTRLTFSPGEDAHPMWSPDGSKLVFHSRRTGNLDIFVMNADGTGVMQLTDTPTFEFFPVWSPDGTQITFTGNTLAPEFDAYVMNTDGSGITNITSGDSSGFDGRCDWGVLSPTTRDDCKNEGWRDFNSPDNERFKNQGACIRWFQETERNRLQ